MQGRMPVARFIGKRVSRLIVVVGSKFWVTEHLREEQSKAKAGLRKLANWFKILFSTLANGFSQFHMIRSMNTASTQAWPFSPCVNRIIRLETMVSQTELEHAIYEKVGQIDTLFVSDVSGGCGQAYDIVIVSDQFDGKSTLQRHRLVNDRLKNEIASMHAFSQKTYTTKQFGELKSKYSQQLPTSSSSQSLTRTATGSEAVVTPQPVQKNTSPTSIDAMSTEAFPNAKESASARVTRVEIPPRTSDSISVPELTLTPVSESKSRFGPFSPQTEPQLRSPSASTIDLHQPASTLENVNISRLHHANITNPQFWLRLRGLLQSELMQGSTAAGEDAMAIDGESAPRLRAGVVGASEVETLFEDFFLSQKNYLSANDIARIRDATGMHGMSS